MVVELGALGWQRFAGNILTAPAYEARGALRVRYQKPGPGFERQYLYVVGLPGAGLAQRGVSEIFFPPGLGLLHDGAHAVIAHPLFATFPVPVYFRLRCFVGIHDPRNSPLWAEPLLPEPPLAVPPSFSEPSPEPCPQDPARAACTTGTMKGLKIETHHTRPNRSASWLELLMIIICN